MPYRFIHKLPESYEDFAIGVDEEDQLTIGTELADTVGALGFCTNCCERMIDARGLALAILGRYGMEENLHEVEELEVQIADTGLRVISAGNPDICNICEYFEQNPHEAGDTVRTDAG